jgi:hypothetical protein
VSQGFPPGPTITPLARVSEFKEKEEGSKREDLKYLILCFALRTSSCALASAKGVKAIEDRRGQVKAGG